MIGQVVAGHASTPPLEPQPEPEVIRAAALIDGWEGDGGHLESARAELDAALKRNPKSATAYREYARYYLVSEPDISGQPVLGSLDAALMSVDRAIELAPGFARAHVLRGHVLTLMGQLDQADAALAKADAIGTDDPWLALNRARLRMRQGKLIETAELCRDVSGRSQVRRIRLSADECLVDFYEATGQFQRMDDTYRHMLTYASDNAWMRGNYSGYLLCAKSDESGAVREARAALAIMDYGNARFRLASALYRSWATQWEAGRQEQAQPLLDEARGLVDASPAEVVAASCGGKKVVAVLRALYRSGQLEPQPAINAITLAATRRDGVPGVFEVLVRGTGSDEKFVYANTMADYRDPASLTIRFTSEAAQALAKPRGGTARDLLMDKRLVVAGFVRRERIDLLREGRPTGRYYYQTHLWVTDAAQVLELGTGASVPVNPATIMRNALPPASSATPTRVTRSPGSARRSRGRSRG